VKSTGNDFRVSWKHLNSLKYRIVDWGLVLAGMASCILICWFTLGEPFSFYLWAIVLCVYFLFYRRLAQVMYWSWSTFRLMKRHHPVNTNITEYHRANKLENYPEFHILVASYKANESIGPVIRAVANQDYPQEHYHAWIITENAEQIETKGQAEALTKRALNFDTNGERDGNLMPFFWYCISREISSLDIWLESVTSGPLSTYLHCEESCEWVQKDLFSRLLGMQDRGETFSSEIIEHLGLEKGEMVLIERELLNIEERVQEISDDFSRLLGGQNIYRRRDLHTQFIAKSCQRRELRRIFQRICHNLATPSRDINLPDPTIVRRTVTKIRYSTQDVIQRTIMELGTKNIHHLDPHYRGFKPGALNVAFWQIEKEGFIKNPENTFFIIIDSDSLLPAYALKTIGTEIRQTRHHREILQMASIPTANFFSGGWYSKFLSFADAVGAVGKWARSTRRQLKPDLHAGSGVVVPATLVNFIDRQVGSPWDESTLTEDARLIIGQFGMMNGVRNKTRMAPVFLLEGVPGEDDFWETYKSFWNQRRRWTTGGFDEVFYMLSSPDWLRHTRYNPSLQEWETYQPGSWNRLFSRIRQFRRLSLWIWDHFVWGIGGFIVLTHWWLVSILVTGPSRPIGWIGFVLLAGSPLLFLVASGQQLSWFIPGGLSNRRKLLLYFQSFIAVWFYCLPVVATQLACILGFRGKFIDWKPTQKPRYQIDIPL
jgi:cellulose synthase/poly-beta-1,6-N-acetylglucosamine synthase-like glycosyltransferase